jgi:TPR repeat protein
MASRCELLPTAIHLQAYSDTGDEVLDWFLAFAERERLEFFDPQTEEITTADATGLKLRLAAATAAEREYRLRRDFPELLERANSKDPRALVELGNRYSFGDGVARDLEQAFSLYLRAADLGFSDGMFNVAACYRLGEGVAKDLAAAAAWYERALQDDKVFAPFALGELYSTPDGLPNDTVKAIAYFQIALDSGHQDARRELRRLGALPPLNPRQS